MEKDDGCEYAFCAVHECTHTYTLTTPRLPSHEEILAHDIEWPRANMALDLATFD